MRLVMARTLVAAAVVTADGGSMQGATVSATGGLSSMDKDEVMHATHLYQQQMAAKAGCESAR